jgi:UDP-N-acetylglucosamine 2-epimerase (non-hydrolysing)
MRICTIVSTRPEIIRLSRIIAKLDEVCLHTLVYTGQNFDPKLSTIFFEDLGIRKPDLHLGNTSANFGEQIGLMFSKVEAYLKEQKPDKVLILGDTNGCLCSIIAKKLHIPVVHMEAGNRCGMWIDEEINRHLVDSISDVHLPYTSLSKENLVREGIPNNRIFVIGNPIAEVLDYYKDKIDSSNALAKYNLYKDNGTIKPYIISTFHRNENVTDEFILNHLIKGVGEVADVLGYEVICPIHPKTRSNISKFNIKEPNGVKFIDPIGFFDFVALEKHAKCIISDSGTCPEEGCILGVPSIIIRLTTERPELIQCGSALLSGTLSRDILQATNIITKFDKKWTVPEEYKVKDVSDRVVKLLLGNVGSI